MHHSSHLYMTNYNLNANQETLETYKHPWYTQQSLLENTTNSEFQSKLKPNKEETGLRFTDKSRTGDYYELLVTLAAWEKGVEVFRNIGCSGKIDLVFARGTEDLLSVDVALMTKNGQGSYGCNGGASSKVATPVLVHPITRQIRWVRGKEPKGWEDFWD